VPAAVLSPRPRRRSGPMNKGCGVFGQEAGLSADRRSGRRAFRDGATPEISGRSSWPRPSSARLPGCRGERRTLSNVAAATGVAVAAAGYVTSPAIGSCHRIAAVSPRASPSPRRRSGPMNTEAVGLRAGKRACPPIAVPAGGPYEAARLPKFPVGVHGPRPSSGRRSGRAGVRFSIRCSPRHPRRRPDEASVARENGGG
jgi:hypothetical protein